MNELLFLVPSDFWLCMPSQNLTVLLSHSFLGWIKQTCRNITSWNYFAAARGQSHYLLTSFQGLAVFFSLSFFKVTFSTHMLSRSLAVNLNKFRSKSFLKCFLVSENSWEWSMKEKIPIEWQFYALLISGVRGEWPDYLKQIGTKITTCYSQSTSLDAQHIDLKMTGYGSRRSHWVSLLSP